jgi:cation transport regulator ChaC
VFVFGYGSLASEVAAAATVASIRGFVRTWDVAMDNLAQIPGYKYYVDPATGERPAVHVTFLNLTPDADADTVGFLLEVTPYTLARLDHRERNYDRVEVTDRVRTDPAIKTRVYAYFGRPEARERYTAAIAQNTAVIAAQYLEQVEASFAAHHLTERYEASTRPPACPVRELSRVNLRPA